MKKFKEKRINITCECGHIELNKKYDMCSWGFICPRCRKIYWVSSFDRWWENG